MTVSVMAIAASATRTTASRGSRLGECHISVSRVVSSSTGAAYGGVVERIV